MQFSMCVQAGVAHSQPHHLRITSGILGIDIHLEQDADWLLVSHPVQQLLFIGSELIVSADTVGACGIFNVKFTVI